MKHLLVTNDFPPKIGGIQSLLWEWWRRLPADRFAVLTSPYRGSAAWDAEQAVPRGTDQGTGLAPTPAHGAPRRPARRRDRCRTRRDRSRGAARPDRPIAALPYAVVVHGAEVTVPGRLPGAKQGLAFVLQRASVVIAAGGYPAAEAERAAGRPLPTTIVPPGVDTERFRPLTVAERSEARQRHGLPVDAPVVLGVSRLVPRKGFDTAIEAINLVRDRVPGVVLAIAGSGRDKHRLERLAAETGAPVRFLGRVANDELPALYGCADAFAMLCRNRWGGLEQEGFGIVFVEAASVGVAQVAGRSGGAHEAVEHGVTGFVIDEPTDARAVADALATILTDDVLRAAMAQASRTRAVTQFSYDVLAERLGRALGALP